MGGIKIKYKYKLYINGVLIDYFKTIKEIDEWLFDHNLDNGREYIEVKLA